MMLLLTLEEAARYGLLSCTCGHPENNHFEFHDRPCAHCGCQKYIVTARVGKLVDSQEGE